MTKIFLDACVLVPIGLTNVILTAAEHSLTQPYWSPSVVEEAVRAIVENRPGLAEDRIRRRFTAMDAAFPGASVSAETSMLDDYDFPDPCDKHVAAGALAAGAQSLVGLDSRRGTCLRRAAKRTMTAAKMVATRKTSEIAAASELNRAARTGGDN